MTACDKPGDSPSWYVRKAMKERTPRNGRGTQSPSASLRAKRVDDRPQISRNLRKRKKISTQGKAAACGKLMAT